MDPFYLALSNFRKRKFEKSASICTELLEKNPYDQVSIYKMIFEETILKDYYFC